MHGNNYVYACFSVLSLQDSMKYNAIQNQRYLDTVCCKAIGSSLCDLVHVKGALRNSKIDQPISIAFVILSSLQL